MAHGVTPEQSWVELINQKLSPEFINRGLSGDTTGGMLARLHEYIMHDQPTHVIIMGGTNDLCFDLPFNLILSNIHAMTRQLKYQGIIPIIGIPTPILQDGFDLASCDFISNNLLIYRLKQYTNLLKNYAAKNEFGIIDFYANFKEHMMSDDGVHPNEKGHVYMSETLIKYFSKL